MNVIKLLAVCSGDRNIKNVLEYNPIIALKIVDDRKLGPIELLQASGKGAGLEVSELGVLCFSFKRKTIQTRLSRLPKIR